MPGRCGVFRFYASEIMSTEFKIFAAPVQGHTDAAWRALHTAEYSPGSDAYFTPFMRVEKGAPRLKDIADLDAMREGVEVVPQVIFRDADELRILLEALYGRGERRIDINMGCPFPLQTARGRGAAVIADRGLLESVSGLLRQYPDVEFSGKMRLGLRSADEWEATMDVINSMPLGHLTVHPRYARQQYGGVPDMDAFGRLVALSAHPVIYNGDIRTPDDISRLRKEHPKIFGVMVGRGLLGRPSLIEEYRNGAEMSATERLERQLSFHARLLDHYRGVLCGDGQILSKIKPFWEYAQDEIGRKAWKAIRKSTTMPKYLSAIAMIS